MQEGGRSFFKIGERGHDGDMLRSLIPGDITLPMGRRRLEKEEVGGGAKFFHRRKGMIFITASVALVTRDSPVESTVKEHHVYLCFLIHFPVHPSLTIPESLGLHQIFYNTINILPVTQRQS